MAKHQTGTASGAAAGVATARASSALERVINLILCSLLGGLTAFAASHEPSIPAVALYTDFQHEMPPVILQTVQGEVDSIISPIVVTLAWRLPIRNAGDEISFTLVFIRFKGDCDVTDLSIYPPYPFILGSTATADGEILPFADIYCNAIRAVIAPQLASLDANTRAVSFGRAVGRVVAHELFHILAKTKHHASRGLAQRALQQEQLTEEEFRFAQKDMQKLRIRMMPVLLQASGVFRGSVPALGTRTFIRSGCVGCHGVSGVGTRWGPSLYTARKSYDDARLRFRLSDNRTEMYRRAEKLGIMWPTLTETEISDLTQFLKYLAR